MRLAAIGAGRSVRGALAQRRLGQGADDLVARLLQFRPQATARLGGPSGHRPANGSPPHSTAAVVSSPIASVSWPSSSDASACLVKARKRNASHRVVQAAWLGGDETVIAFLALIRRHIKATVAIAQRTSQ